MSDGSKFGTHSIALSILLVAFAIMVGPAKLADTGGKIAAQFFRTGEPSITIASSPLFLNEWFIVGLFGGVLLLILILAIADARQD